MSKILRLIFLTALFLSCLSTLSQAQNDAVVVGQIDSATSRAVRVEFKRNQFLLEDGAFETVLDANNTFSFRVKLSESRSVNLVHRNESVRLFLTPGDTLKLHFKSKHMLETMVYDGSAALHNDYLLKAEVQLGELNNDNQAKFSVETASAKTHLAFIDSIYLEKKRFYDGYPTDIKASFSNDFLDFSLNDNTYWRAFYLMDFVRKNGFTNPNPDKQVDDGYFNFLFETDNAYYKALNNQNYLKYLDLYLGYIREKSGRGKQTDGDTTEIHTHTVQKIRSKGQNVRVIEEPYLKNDVISWLSNHEEADYQNLSTSEKFKYVSGDTIFEDMFLKIRTAEGRYGWVPQSLVVNYDKTTFDTVHIRRFCYQPEKDFCGFEDNLTGKVLYFTMTKDILMSFMYDKEELMRKRMATFIGRNTSYEEYNAILRTALQHTLVDRLRGQQNKVSIPPSLEVERYDNDRAFYTAELNRLQLAKRNVNNNVELFAAKVAARQAKIKLAEEMRLKAERALKDKLAEEARLKTEREAKAKLAEEARRKAEQEAAEKLALEARRKMEKDAADKLAEEARLKLEQEAADKLAAQARLKAEQEAAVKLAEQTRLNAEKEAVNKLAAEARRKAEKEAADKLAAETQLKTEKEVADKLAAETQLKTEKEAADKLAAETRLKVAKEAADKLAAETRRKAEQDAAGLADQATRQKSEKEAADKLAAETQLKSEKETARLAAAARQKSEKEAAERLVAEARQKAEKEAAEQAKLAQNNPPKEPAPPSVDSLVKNKQSLFTQNVVTNANGVTDPNTIMNDPKDKHPKNPNDIESPSGNIKLIRKADGTYVAVENPNGVPDKPVPTTPSEQIVKTNDPTRKTVRFVAPQGVELDTTQEIMPLMEQLEFDPTGQFVEFKGMVINEDMPKFVLTDINGKQVTPEELKNKVVFIDFWASWCGPCVAQFSHVRGLMDKYKNDDVLFLFISIDSDMDAWRGHLKDSPMAGIHGNDKMILPINFQVSGIPNSFIIGRNGKVAFNSRLKSKVKDERVIQILLRGN